jgi:hypothetical protein
MSAQGWSAATTLGIKTKKSFQPRKGSPREEPFQGSITLSFYCYPRVLAFGSNPGLKLANAFGVNWQKLANAFGVNWQN